MHYCRSYKKTDTGCAATLLTCLVTSCKDCQALHTFLPQILVLTLSTLEQTKEKNTRTRLLEIVMAAFYYNAELTLSVLGTDATVAPALFGVLFDHLNNMERDFTQRLVVLSFSALLATPPTALPEIVRNNFPAMFQQVIRELVLIEEEAAREQDEDDEEGGGEYGGFNEDDEDDNILGVDDSDNEDSDEDDKDPKKAAARRAKALFVPDGGYGEEEDCLNAEDESYRQALEQMGKDDVKRAKYSGGEFEGDSDDDSMEDLSFTSPIENMNVVQHFLDTMNMLQLRDGGALTTSLQAGLGEEDRGRLQQLIATAQERAAAAASGSA